MGKILSTVLGGIFSVVSRELDRTVGSNGGDRKVRRLQQERVRYKDELDKAKGQKPSGH